MIKCIQPQDWFAAIDLKDAYFHVLILLRHRPFLRFAFEDRAWQYRVLPFGLSLSPRVFMKVVEGALTPIREVEPFLQERLEHRLSPSTLKVCVAAIATHHDAVDGRSLGKHDLIMRFLKGARRMNPSRSPLTPSWDLSIVLAELQRGPFELLDSS